MAFIPLYSVTSFPACYADSFKAVKKSFAVITASQNNYDLGIDTALDLGSNPGGVTGLFPRIFELRCTTASNITGIVAPTGTTPYPIIIRNTGTATLTLKNASGSSTAGNKLNVTRGNSGSDFDIVAGDTAVLQYDYTLATDWTVAAPMYSGAFKLMVLSGGAMVLLDHAFWSVHNTGYYNVSTTKTPNAVDVYYSYGTAAPTLTYATDTTATLTSQPVEPGRDEIVQAKRGVYSLYWLTTSGSVTMRFRKNEQGEGFNKQQGT